MRVVATAGHVDHGKSTLVRALTGMEPDRWAEERRRGMTIDLGYAWTTLPSGMELAFVDVPGHQRFIANMLAGLGPAPAVLFVVAADAGWSRQSEEHLLAMAALGVRHAVLAVTRSDLADPGEALATARARLGRASIDAPAVAVSGRDGTGLDQLRSALDDLAAALPVPPDDADVRMWIDRSFTIRGSGTVVTGTLAAGHIAVGDALELAGRTVRVRGLQALGRPHERLTAPARVAVNLRDVAPADAPRGTVLLTPGAWRVTDLLDVRVTAPATTADDLASHLVLHVGTDAVAVRVRPLGGDLVRLLLDRPVPLRVGDRGVMRDPGLQAIAAGVVVLDAEPPALTRRGDAARRAAELRSGPPSAAGEIARRGAVRRAHLARLGLPVDGAVDAQSAQSVGDWLVSRPQWQAWVEEVRPAVEGWAARDPLQPQMPLSALAQELGLPDAALLPAVLSDAGLSSLAGRVGSPPAADLGPAEAGLHRLEQRLRERPFDAPIADELRDWRLGHRELTAAARAGRVLRLPGDVVLLPTAVEAARVTLRELDPPFTAAQARQALGTTRRVAIPLLEELDRLGLTERVDASSRRLRDS